MRTGVADVLFQPVWLILQWQFPPPHDHRHLTSFMMSSWPAFKVESIIYEGGSANESDEVSNLSIHTTCIVKSRMDLNNRS